MRKHILVVDDDRALRSLLQALLESEGYAVESASDGHIAWEKLVRQPERYEAVILDVEMPRMNGLQLLQALGQPEAGRAPPFLVMSANSEALHQARRMGVRHVLEKPFPLEALLTFVATSLA